MALFAIPISAISRLACQITVTAELDGLRVTTPVSQR
jgi:ferredoxin